jgi:hypothetical protein
VGIPSTVGFRLSRSHRLSRSPFTFFPFLIIEFRLSLSLLRIFSFTRWNSGYHGAFHECFFHTMEFWLSRSLSRNFFLSHDGILAITEPFTIFSHG